VFGSVLGHDNPGTISLEHLLKGSAKLLGAKSDGGATGAAKEGEEECEDEDSGEESQGTAGKRKAPRRGAAKAKAKGKAKAEVELKRKRKQPKALASAEEGAAKRRGKPDSLDAKKLLENFPGTKKRGPIYFGKSTIYIDRGNKLWRIKPCTGSRACIVRSFKVAEPKAVWKEVASVVARLNKA
jgi:hypothetical protein